MICDCCWTWILAGVVGLLLALAFYLRDVAPKFELKGRRVLVTGGSEGIGLAVVKRLLEKGAHVCILARTKSKLERAVADVQGENRVIHFVTGDVSDAAAVTSAVAKAAEKLGGLDALVHCAGIPLPGYFQDIPPEGFQRVMNVNYLGSVYTAKAVVPFLKQSGGGRIMFVSSLAGMSGVVGFSAYCPTKAAIRSLAECLHMELRPHNIFTSIAIPPDVDTPGYAEEQKIKPIECARISEGAGLFSPEAVSADIIASLEHWTFFVSTGFDGSLSASLGAGTSPAANPLRVVLEVFFLGVVRLVALFYLKGWNDICADEHAKRTQATTASTATSTVASTATSTAPVLNKGKKGKKKKRK